MPNPNSLTLIVVVNGQPFTLEANIQAPLKTVIQHALTSSGNSGQPTENWELRDGAGEILDPNRKVEEFNFTPDTRLFLNLKAGIGG